MALHFLLPSAKGNVTALMMGPKPPNYQPGEGRVTPTENTEIPDSENGSFLFLCSSQERLGVEDTDFEGVMQNLLGELI